MKNKFLNIACWLIAIVIFGISCEKEPQYREFNYPAAVPSGMSPTTGYPMTNVTIAGTNFDTLKGAVKIWFGSIQATNLVSVKGNEIVVQVPANAVSGKVSLQVWTTKVDSIGNYTVLAAPEITADYTNNAQPNIAFPGDTVYIKGKRFGTDVSKMQIKMSGTAVTDIPLVNDTIIKLVAPASFSTGAVTLTMGGLTISGPTPIINPEAPGNLTPYFMANTGDTTKGGGFVIGSSMIANRWGTLAAPWVTNAAAKNKSGEGGWAREQWNAQPGFLCLETWGNTPVTDGIIYQPTSMPLPAGNYTVSVKYYSEVQANSLVTLVVNSGGSGIPNTANLSSALASVALANPSAVGTTAPNVTETKSLDFTLSSSQVVSIGFLANLLWGNGSANPGCYIKVDWIKLVKN